MKKLIMAAAIVCAAVSANAAKVGWSSISLADYKGDQYLFFINGQNGASIAAVTALLDEGKSADSLAFAAPGTVNSSGMISQAAATSSYTIGAGTYTGFFVLFDTAAPKAGESKYAVLSGASGLTQNVGTETATITFAGGQGPAIMGDWKSYGAVPEPTSGLLLLLGVAGLALRRRRA